MNDTKFYIGPMSKNVVDSIIEFTEETGLDPEPTDIDWESPTNIPKCKYQVYFRNNNDDSSAAYHVVLGGGQHGGTNTMPSYVIAMEVGA